MIAMKLNLVLSPIPTNIFVLNVTDNWLTRSESCFCLRNTNQGIFLLRTTETFCCSLSCLFQWKFVWDNHNSKIASLIHKTGYYVNHITSHIHRADSKLAPSQWERPYKVTPSLIGWVQTKNQPCIDISYHIQTQIHTHKIHPLFIIIFKHGMISILLISRPDETYIDGLKQKRRDSIKK